MTTVRDGGEVGAGSRTQSPKTDSQSPGKPLSAGVPLCECGAYAEMKWTAANRGPYDIGNRPTCSERANGGAASVTSSPSTSAANIPSLRQTRISASCPGEPSTIASTEPSAGQGYRIPGSRVALSIAD
jgi:hypothetical protein